MSDQREQTRRDAEERLRGLIARYMPSGFRDEDGVWHDGPLQSAAIDDLNDILEAVEQAERERDLKHAQVNAYALRVTELEAELRDCENTLSETRL